MDKSPSALLQLRPCAHYPNDLLRSNHSEKQLVYCLQQASKKLTLHKTKKPHYCGSFGSTF